MSKFIMNIDFFDREIAARTDTNMISLNDMFNAGNALRLAENKSILQISAFLSSKTVADYVEAAALEWGIGEDQFVKKGGKGRNSQTWVHVGLAMLAAEQLSPRFHAHIHRVFIEGRLLEHRIMGATEFKRLNALIESKLLGGVSSESDRVLYMTVAKRIRQSVIGNDSKINWNNATVEQTQKRQSLESDLCKLLKLDMVESPKHLLELIEKLTKE